MKDELVRRYYMARDHGVRDPEFLLGMLLGQYPRNFLARDVRDFLDFAREHQLDVELYKYEDWQQLVREESVRVELSQFPPTR